jgi:hypothetical protein
MAQIALEHEVAPALRRGAAARSAPAIMGIVPQPGCDRPIRFP